MAITGSELAWINSFEHFSFTFAKNLEPAELFRRMGAEASSVAYRTESQIEEDLPDDSIFAPGARGGRWEDWAWLSENFGLHATETSLIGPVSAGTEVVSVYRDVKVNTYFTYAREGRVVVHFSGHYSDDREGSNPDLLNDVMRSAGFALDPDKDDEIESYGAAVLYMAALAFGISLPSDQFDSYPILSGRLKELGG